MSARFSIGIDLGTTNSALAFAPLEGDARSEVLAISQWESLSLLTEAVVLPSFLYLPEDGIAGQLFARDDGPGEWVVGRLARKKVAECPGRVVHSAKSWLCHHGADPATAFLPWGSDEIAPDRKISPMRASALILNALRGAWDGHFAAAGADYLFDAQEITIAVPASFDAVAQRLTLAAANEAGFAATVRLLEEPQAAFYAWLERHDPIRDLWRQLPPRIGEPHHILVVDVGGGTSDFSLFEMRASPSGPLPAIRRIAVSDHILLGGDNIDLAIAHRVEQRLVSDRGKLSGAQWDYLVARCRDLKERALAGEGAADEIFPVAVPGRSAGLLAGTLSAQVSRAEIDEILFEGFFPRCDALDRPRRSHTALREWGLPFAADSAITRHLAGFLGGRPRADAILFNGGSLSPPRLRQRLCDQIATWQGGEPPLVLHDAEPDLAVARGAACYGKLLRRKAERIEAGAAHSVFLALHRKSSRSGEDKAAPPLICMLPHGAAPEETFEVADLAIELRVNRPVRFQTYTSTRHERTRAGSLVEWNADDFRPLPPLETVARLDGSSGGNVKRTLPVALDACLNELGLLQISCRSTDPDVSRSWPLEFNLRPHERADVLAEIDNTAMAMEPNVAPGSMELAEKRLRALFAPPSSGRQAKMTGARAFKDLEVVFALPKSDWNWVVIRSLWPTLEKCMPGRALSIEHEETWLILAGFLLRPGFGAAMDDVRIDGLWRLQDAGLCFPGRRIKIQMHILWRRVAGGLSRERQEWLFANEIETIRRRKDAPPELVHLLGSLERLGHDAKKELVTRLLDVALSLAREKRHATPYLTALGLLLNRAPLYAGPETVLPPDLVERSFEAFAPFDWQHPTLAELNTLFLRAARVVGDRSLDLPRALRQRIASKLEKSGVTPLRVAKVRDLMPIERGERLSLYSEPLPPGLLLNEA